MQKTPILAKKLTSLMLLVSLALGLVATSLPKTAHAAAEYTFGFFDNTAQTIEEGNRKTFIIWPSAVTGQFETDSNFQISYEIIPTGNFDSADFTFNGSSNLTGTIDFPVHGGQEAVLPLLTITDDAVVEAAESFEIHLTSVTDPAGNNTAVIDPNFDSITITVQDYNGDPKLNFAVSEGEGLENQPGVFTVTLSRPTATDVTFDWNTDSGTAIGPISNPDPNNPENDYNSPTLFATSVIPAGALSFNLPVTVFDDNVDELDETIVTIITGISAGSAVVGLDNTLDYTIVDNDTSVAQFSTANYSGLESDVAVKAKITLTQPGDREVRVYVEGDTTNSTASSADWNFINGPIVFAAGDTQKDAEFSVVNDSDFEPDETAIIYITSADNAEVGSPSTTTYTILNDDQDPNPPVYGTAIPQATASVGGVPVGSVVVPTTPSTPVENPSTPNSPTPNIPTAPSTGGEVLGEQITNLDELIAKLTYGNTGDEVNQLQTGLQQLGFFPIAIKTTRFYGPITKRAVEKYLDSKQWTLDQLVAMLHYNNRGMSVASLQTQLRDLKFFPNWVRSTGWYGPITQGSVIKYKAAK